MCTVDREQYRRTLQIPDAWHDHSTYSTNSNHDPTTDWAMMPKPVEAGVDLHHHHPRSTESLHDYTSDERSQRRRDHHEADIVVVGAGILGCAISVALASQGRSVILLERSWKEPDRIVGEFLQPGGIAVLEKLGLGGCIEEIDAIAAHGYDLIYYGEEAVIPFPQHLDPTPPSIRDSQTRTDHTKAPRARNEARAFHHGRFISRLRQRAVSTPNITVFESTANDLVRAGHNGQVLGVEATTHGRKDCFFAHLTIIADGYASNFRKQFASRAPVARSKFWGLELIDCKLPRVNHGHVVLSDEAPVLLYQIGERETRALVDVPEKTTSALPQNGGIKNHLRNVVLPTLPAEVQPSFEAAIDSGRLKAMPNSWLPPSMNRTAGVMLLGDAMNMRHPITGGGMTVALNDALLLSELLDPSTVPRLDDTALVLAQLRTFHRQRKKLTGVVNIMAQAIYALFAANDAQLKALQFGCFRYLQAGGDCTAGPGGLLGCLIRRPVILFYHFFAVALYSIWLHVSGATSVVSLPGKLFDSFGILWKACVVLFPYMVSEF